MMAIGCVEFPAAGGSLVNDRDVLDVRSPSCRKA
jgi:hypothetical protein